MDAGKLNTRITIKRLAKTSDNFGGTTTTESTLKSIWAFKKDIGGEIKTENGKRSRYVTSEFTVREKALDNVLINDLILVEDETVPYRINDLIETDDKYYKILKATKNG